MDTLKLLNLVNFIRSEIAKRHIEEYDLQTKQKLLAALEFFKKFFCFKEDVCVFPEIVHLLIKKFKNEINNKTTLDIFNHIFELNELILNNENNKINIKSLIDIWNINPYIYEFYSVILGLIDNSIDKHNIGKIKKSVISLFNYLKIIIELSEKYCFPALYLIFPINMIDFCLNKIDSFECFYSYIDNNNGLRVLTPTLYKNTINGKEIETTIPSCIITSKNEEILDEIYILETLIHYSYITHESFENKNIYNDIYKKIFKRNYGLDFKDATINDLLLGLCKWDIDKQYGNNSTIKSKEIYKICNKFKGDKKNKIKNVSSAKINTAYAIKYNTIKLASTYKKIKKSNYYNPSEFPHIKPMSDTNFARYKYEDVYNNINIKKINAYEILMQEYIYNVPKSILPPSDFLVFFE